MKRVVIYRGKPYFYWKTLQSLQTLPNIKRQHPKLRYYWVKSYNTRKKKTAYLLYTDKVIW